MLTTNHELYQTYLKSNILKSLPVDSPLFKFYTKNGNFDKILEPLPLSLSILEKQKLALENAGLNMSSSSLDRKIEEETRNFPKIGDILNDDRDIDDMFSTESEDSDSESGSESISKDPIPPETVPVPPTIEEKDTKPSIEIIDDYKMSTSPRSFIESNSLPNHNLATPKLGFKSLSNTSQTGVVNANARNFTPVGHGTGKLSLVSSPEYQNSPFRQQMNNLSSFSTYEIRDLQNVHAGKVTAKNSQIGQKGMNASQLSKTSSKSTIFSKLTNFFKESKSLKERDANNRHSSGKETQRETQRQNKESKNSKHKGVYRQLSKSQQLTPPYTLHSIESLHILLYFDSIYYIQMLIKQ